MKRLNSLFAQGTLAAPARIVAVPHLHGQRLRAALTEETAYVVGLPTLLAEPRVIQVTPCPDNGNVLITREVYESALVPGSLSETPVEVQILLYNARRRRVAKLFHYKAQNGELPRVGKFFWWVGGERASFSLHLSSPDGKEMLTLPFLINLVTEQSVPITLAPLKDASLFHLPSPTKPFALITTYSKTDDQETIFLVGPEGRARLVHDKSASPVFLPDGESVLLTPVNEQGEASYRRFYPLTGKEEGLTPVEGERLARAQVRQGERDERLATELPLRLVERRSAGEPSLSLLYLAPQVGKKGEEVLLLGDAEPAGLTRDLQNVLYFQQGQLFLMPLQSLPRSVFQAQQEKELRELTLRRLRSVHIKLQNTYRRPPEHRWPTAEVPLEQLFPEGGGNDRTILQNPATDRDDLRLEYDGRSDPDNPRTRVASLGGPGGRAVIYGDGRIVWEAGR